MKSITTGLLALFTSGASFFKANCYKIELTNGTVLKFTDYDRDVVLGGDTWLATGPLITRSSLRTVIGLELDTLQISIIPDAQPLVGSLTWTQAVGRGVLDGARITLDEAFIDLSGVVQGTINKFVGNIAQLSLDRQQIEITVESPLVILSTQMPRNLYQASCIHTLYDSGCKAVKVANTVSGIVSGTPTRDTFSSNVTTGAVGRYSLGTLVFTSGGLSGTKRSVKQWNSTGQIILLNALPFAPTAGDTFQVSAGCNRTKESCESKFANLDNFKAWPFIPVPETAT